MKALKSNLLEAQTESRGSDRTDQVLETIDSMSDDERVLLYENGVALTPAVNSGHETIHHAAFFGA